MPNGNSRGGETDSVGNNVEAKIGDFFNTSVQNANKMRGKVLFFAKRFANVINLYYLCVRF